MYQHVNNCIFPRLTYLESVHFKSWSEDKECGLYKLDWSKKNQVCREHHEKWCKDYGHEFEWSNDLPDPYEQWANELLFAVPYNYMNEIHRCTMAFQIESNVPRSFDTLVRDHCLKPREAFAEVAFYLLCDCLYDSEKNYFYHGPDKSIAQPALMYKFWLHQTGRGLVRGFAGFNKLEDWVEEKNVAWRRSEEERVAIRKFLEAMKTQEEIKEVGWRKNTQMVGKIVIE
jgi:hypothetical protein